MNLLYLHQYFKTPSHSGGTRSYFFSKALIERGHHVTMITSRSKNKNKLFETETVDNIKVIYIEVPYNNTMGKIQRIISFLKFVVLSSIVALKQKKIDLVYATSTPLTIGIPALILKMLKRKKFIFEVRDLWPDIPFELGIINNKVLQSLLYKFEKIIYHYSEHIVALSPGMMKGIIKKGIPAAKIDVVSNYSSNDLFFSCKKNGILHQRLNIPDERIICIHTGAMGKVNGLIEFVNNFAKKSPDLDFVFIGEGAEKVELLKLSSTLKNIHILDAVAKHHLNDYIQDSDFCMMLVDPKYKIFETNSANKFFEYLSSGKPIIMNYGGWKLKELEDNNCGFHIDSQNPGELVSKIENLKENEVLFRKMSENSRKLAEEKFDRKILCKKLIDIMEKVNGGK